MKIGLIVGSEWSFAPALIEAIDARMGAGTAGYVNLGAVRVGSAPPHAVIFDRFSHRVPFYRMYLRHAVLQGVRVLNDPHVLDREDRFSAATRALALDIPTPHALLLPQRGYAEGIVHEESLRNLDYPLDWDAIVDAVGTPFILRAARPAPGEADVRIGSIDELLDAYGRSGERPMIVQEMVAAKPFVRCLVIGGDALVLTYDPATRRYPDSAGAIPASAEEFILTRSRRYAGAAGYDALAIDWAITDDGPIAVDLIDSAPELDLYTLAGAAFDRAVEMGANLLCGVLAAGEAGGGVERALRLPGDRSDRDGAGDLAEEFPSLAQGLPRSTLQE